VTKDPAYAVTWLFVPGSRPDRFAKALAAGADMVILDLEDAVAPDDKDRARTAVAELLATGVQVAVRINPSGTPWHQGDLDLVTNHPCTLIVSKAEDPAAVTAIADAANRTVVPLIESAAGVLNAHAIAQTPGVCRLALGNADLAAQMGVDPSDQAALLWTRSALVMASADANIAAPVDGVTLTVDEPSSASDAADHARRLGFRGKLCIHPSQILRVRQAFAPTDAEIRWARRIIEASGATDGGVAVVDGTMVDRPVLIRARAILAMVPSSTD
jgi:citrate lyase subunit beta/citryl-CoA lyase